MKSVVLCFLCSALLLTGGSCSKCPLNQPSPKWYYIYIEEFDSTTAKKKIQISYLEMHGSSNIIRTDSVSLPYYNSFDYTYSDCKFPVPFLQINNNGVTLKAYIDDGAIKFKDNCSIAVAFGTYGSSSDCNYLLSYPKDSLVSYAKKVKSPGYMEMLASDKNKTVYLPDWTWKANP